VILEAFIVYSPVFDQKLTVVPADPTVDSTIMLVYDATQGNGELAGYAGDVYLFASTFSITIGKTALSVFMYTNSLISEIQIYQNGRAILVNCHQCQIVYYICSCMAFRISHILLNIFSF
jgi:hypothetical protein